MLVGCAWPRNFDLCGTPSRKIEQFGPFGSKTMSKRQMTVATGSSTAFARGHLASPMSRLAAVGVIGNGNFSH
jgi:hypothetical protein